MAYRRRHRGKTAARGYGWAHVKTQRTAIAAWKPGDPCTRCGQPMWHRWMLDSRGRRVSAIHLAHTPDRTGYEGLQHARCNLSEAGTRGNRMRGVARAWRTSRHW
jgi:hypothetical protein